MTKSSGSKTGTQVGGYKDRFWYFRFWYGMNLSGWMRLLARNHFAISPSRVAMAVLVAGVSGVNSLFRGAQALMWGRRIARTEISEPPIFIIGHWRTGTTMLHELLVLDPRHTYPDTYACFAPNHFVLTGRWLPKLIGFLLPSRRPIDNMKAGWERPQEDEFALCNLGLGSPYLTLAFSNRPPQCQEYLDMEGVEPEDRRGWKEGLLWFLKCLTLKDPRRIVLKSPPHTARIKILLELFPDARFIHIVRDPQVVFPSTMNLWRRLRHDEGLQTPRYEGLEEYVFQTFEQMYDAFERNRELIDPARFSEVRYEELVADPIGQVRRVYDELELGQFDAVLPALQRYLESVKDYQKNRFETPPELQAEIARRLKPYIEKYGYG